MNKRQPKVTFEHLIAKVEKAEEALEYHEQRQGAARQELKSAWRAAWTPGRILAAGLVTGFLTGRAEPLGQLGKVGGARWLQMISTVVRLFSTVAVAGAAEDAEEAAEVATAVAAGAAGSNATADQAAPAAAAAAAAGAAAAAAVAGGPTDRVRAARPYTGEWQTEPRPAEAATEVSER